MVTKKGYKLSKSEVTSIKYLSGSPRYICNAPFTSMSVGINGYVSPCCYTQSFYAEDEGFDRYPEQSLQEIWNGKNYRKFRKMIRKNRLPRECSICYDGIRNQQFDSLKMHMFNHLRPKNDQPVFLEITIDNTCNLECVMCSSMLSSKIAARENVKFPHFVNHAQFKKEMSEWIPDLQEVVFSGGEPFLSKIYLDLFREIVHKNPDCLISVNTNGNILSDDIKSLMKQGRFHLNISIDSLIKERYEKIRKGGSFETLQKNLAFFQEYAQDKGISLSIPVCPLICNFDEIGNMVRYCNENGIYFDIVHVFNAWDMALRYA
ncbi:MAG: twitch domain-containing radical SAM protein, partial [Bacteroidales bacterium]